MKTQAEGNFKHRQWKSALTFYPSRLRREGWEERVKAQAEKLAADLVATLIDLAKSGHEIRKAELSLFAVVESAPVPKEELATA